MRYSWNVIFAVVVSFGLLFAHDGSATVNADEIPVEATLLKIIETVEIPAQQSGVLEGVRVHEGVIVDREEVVAKINNDEKILEVAKAEVELRIAKREAVNDVNIRFARKSLEVATAELGRSEEALTIAEKSVSQTEMDRLRLIVEKNRLEVEQAQEKTAIAQLTSDLRETELDLVKTQLAKHEIRSPIEGMVVAVFPRTGEWVEKSDTVGKVVRIDRLRAEGFIRNEDAILDLMGATAKVRVNIPRRGEINVQGKVVFIDPEVDPVNGQVRVWVDVDNNDLKLRPGLRAEMTISAPEPSDQS